jgi:hypothetical protein
MIQRLLTTLSDLREIPPSSLAGEHGRRLVADCADAVRLELDCPQQSLTPLQRASLRRLSDLLETNGVPAADLVSSARAAWVALVCDPVRSRGKT